MNCPSRSALNFYQKFSNKSNLIHNYNFLFIKLIKAAQFLHVKFAFLLLIQNCLFIGGGIGVFVVANYAYLKQDKPPLTGELSILNLQPSISMLPRPDSLTSLIKFRMAQRQTYGPYIHDLLGFIHAYERHTQQSRLLDCSNFVAYIDHPKFSCKFSLDLGTKSCNIYNTFGFDQGSPCILIKLNKVFGWVPDLRNVKVKSNVSSIKVKCDGVSEFDKESLGKICYYDEENTMKYRSDISGESDCQSDYGLIRHYYFPYKKQKSYQNPFVWVKFFELKRHVAIMLHCWAIANNIVVDFEKGLGTVQFEIMMD